MVPHNRTVSVFLCPTMSVRNSARAAAKECLSLSPVATPLGDYSPSGARQNLPLPAKNNCTPRAGSATGDSDRTQKQPDPCHNNPGVTTRHRCTCSGGMSQISNLLREVYALFSVRYSHCGILLLALASGQGTAHSTQCFPYNFPDSSGYACC